MFGNARNNTRRGFHQEFHASNSQRRHKSLHARPAQTAQRSVVRQEPAQPQQNQSRLAQTNAPQNLPRLIARIFTQRLLRRIIQQIHQLAVIILLKIMQRTPQQQMQIELAPQFSQRATRPTIQNRLSHAQSPAKSGDDPAHGSPLHLRRRVAHQINRPVPHLPPHWHPPRVHRNPRALKFQRRQTALLQKIFQQLPRLRPRLPNQSQSPARRRFRNQPIKVWRILRHEPHPRRIRRHVFRQRHNRLHQRRGLQRRPSRRPPHPARRSIPSNNSVCVNFLAAAVRATLHFQHQPAPIRMQRMKTPPQFQSRPCPPRFLRQSLYQSPPLDNQIRLLQFKNRRPPNHPPLRRHRRHDALLPPPPPALPRQHRRRQQPPRRPAHHRHSLRG